MRSLLFITCHVASLVEPRTLVFVDTCSSEILESRKLFETCHVCSPPHFLSSFTRFHVSCCLPARKVFTSLRMFIQLNFFRLTCLAFRTKFCSIEKATIFRRVHSRSFVQSCVHYFSSFIVPLHWLSRGLCFLWIQVLRDSFVLRASPFAHLFCCARADRMKYQISHSLRRA